MKTQRPARTSPGINSYGEAARVVEAIRRFLCGVCQGRIGSRLTVNGLRCQQCLHPGMDNGDANPPTWAVKMGEALEVWVVG